MLHAAYAQQSPLWTGPQLASADIAENGGITLTFSPKTASGMHFADVKSVNPDGTRNDCTLCCARGNPFDVTADGGKTWVRVAANETIIDGNRIHLMPSSSQLARASGVGVRYAWLDFVECVLYNDAKLPLGPFVRIIDQHQARAAASSSNAAAPAAAAAAGSSGIPQSPPMGFNSWNFYHCNIDENTVRAVIDAMVSNGMKDAGYEYVNIDDCWQVERFENGTIQPDPVRFPSGMKALADYAHSKGMKFGVYTAKGSVTCQRRPGAYKHEKTDAQSYCDWGLDYLKNDDCGGATWNVGNTSWKLFTEGFQECYEKTGRYIVRSVEYCKDPNSCGKWIADSANLWRTTSDVQATWSSVMSNIHNNKRWLPWPSRVTLTILTCSK